MLNRKIMLVIVELDDVLFCEWVVNGVTYRIEREKEKERK